jgi:hypothetical protein
VRCLDRSGFNSSRIVILSFLLLIVLAVLPAAAWALAPEEPEKSFADWWSENFDIHGFVTTKTYFRSPNFSHNIELSSWRTEINLETELRVFENDDWRVALFSVVRPTFDAVYDIEDDLWGGDADAAAVGTGGAWPGNQNATRSGEGKNFPGAGGRVNGEFTIINSDTGSFFTGEPTPAVAIDDVVFFGRVTAPWLPIGSRQARIGGNATGETYEDLRDNFPLFNGGLAAGTGLDASLTLLASMPLETPLNYYAGGSGDRGSLRWGSVDINRNESQLKWDCRDNAHPYCALRELYAEVEYKNTFMRVGRQQIVWGKTDAFRLQDKINPIDLGYHNVFPDLEERRIPQWSLDLIHSFGNIGPFEDVSLEFAWVWDRFIPDQFGQCGEPYAFTASCEARADAGGHQLFNFSLANVETVKWKIQNTEPGLRLEFRIPEPSIAFSLSAFYTHQDTPVAKFSNFYSTDNPNPAAMLFLQGLYDGGPVANTIEFFAGETPGTTVWSQGFDPYDRSPAGTLFEANDILITAYQNIMGGGGPCGGLGGQTQVDCAAQFAAFVLPWAASEATLKYPRIWALGASADYQIPGIDTVLRIEMAADLNRHITNTALLDMDDKSPVFQMAVGLDRSTFIPFLNRNRTAFLSFQTFLEHIVDYDDGPGHNDGMVAYETSVISTAFMQNYWRNDSIILTNFAAVDWMAGAVIMGPSLRYVYDDHWFFDVGMNVLWGKRRDHNLSDMCADQSYSCLTDPTSWTPGQWQTLNSRFQQAAEAPFWGLESFSDKFMRNRDEFWFGVTYQF